MHTWAPADKHGFGTARQVEQPGRVHAAPGVAVGDLLPRPQHPGVPRPRSSPSPTAGSVTRETVDDDPRHIERVGPGSARASRPMDGTLAYRQVTSTSRWRLTKTWITDPARADRARCACASSRCPQAAAALRARRPCARRRRQRRPRQQRHGSCSPPTTWPPAPCAADPPLGDQQRLPRQRERPLERSPGRRSPDRLRRDGARQRRPGCARPALDGRQAPRT